MNIKNLQLYNLILSGLKTKRELSQTLNVTIKTIENYIKQEKDDIIYSKKLGKYHFKNLLPQKVTYSFVNSIMINSIDNTLLQNDYQKIQQLIILKYDDLIETKNLSEQLQNLIILNISINHNITLEILYKSKEKKLIQPNQILKIKDLYYLFVTYDKKNKKNMNEERTLSLVHMSDIKFIEYSTSLTYKTNHKGNEYGKYSSKKYVLLKLTDDAAIFFKRNRVNYLNWEFINESNDSNSIYIKLFYTSMLEVRRLIQQWLPYIQFVEETAIKREVLNKIQEDIEKVFI